MSILQEAVANIDNVLDSSCIGYNPITDDTDDYRVAIDNLYVPCDECDNGKWVCSECKGSGCSYCDLGYVNCEYCEGDAKVEVYDDEHCLGCDILYPLPQEVNLDITNEQLWNTIIVKRDSCYDDRIYIGSVLEPTEQNTKEIAWNICKTYVSLRYFPPASISVLPPLHRELTDQEEFVLAACRKSLEKIILLNKEKLELFNITWG